MHSGSLPEGVVFTDNGDGSGLFAWTPAIGQEGDQEALFYASDDSVADSQFATVSVTGLDYVCGDANGDPSINIADAVYLINYIFKSGPPPVPLCVADSTGDNSYNVGDAIYIISYVFSGGLPPVDTSCQ